MGSRFGIALIVVAGILGTLIYSASTQTAKAVVRVDELLETNEPRSRVRLGGRLTERTIEVLSEPERQVKFAVHDIPDGQREIPVTYYGALPDTLKAGRDVILEGDFDGSQFVAKSLMTQCPSKYEVPMPGTADGSYKENYQKTESASDGPQQAVPDAAGTY